MHWADGYRNFEPSDVQTDHTLGELVHLGVFYAK
jgi:hypothetical protein